MECRIAKKKEKFPSIIIFKITNTAEARMHYNEKHEAKYLE